MVAAAVTPWQIVNKSLLGLHIVTAFPPLLVGFYLFFPESRKGGNRTHRWLGTVYCVAIWISAVAGLIMAAANSRGIVAQTGFGTLAVIWFSTTLFAYRTAREKDFIAHREWMIRSYAITLAVVTVRPLFLFGPPSGIDADTWYAMVTWLCWLPNLLIAEAYVRSTNVTGRLAIGRGRRRVADGEPRSARPARTNGAARSWTQLIAGRCGRMQAG
jgi:uncharacterized membrane protein